MTPSTSRAPLIITDSCCDLPRPLLAELGVVVLDYPVVLDGEEALDAEGRMLSHTEFYDRVRAGAAPSTAAIPIPAYANAFRRAAEQGRPAVLIGLSAALSGTFDRALTARDLVLADVPDAEIHAVESLNASIALGVLVLEAARRVRGGVGTDGLLAWLEPTRTTVNGYFTLETLEHLRRGGRISDVMAMAGTVLDIKPVLRIDQHGGLVIGAKLRGRRKSMKALVDAAEKRAVDPSTHTVLIGHGDAPAEAEMLRRLVMARVPFRDAITTEVGPVIGSHVGPGMLAVAFIGRSRA